MVSESLVDRAALDELQGVIGCEKLDRLLDRFTASLVTAFEGDREEADYAREAHTLVSMSGMLGCSVLSQACRAFEQAAKLEGDDLANRLAALRSLRDRTVAALQELRETDPAFR